MDRKRIDSSFDIDMIIAEVRELKDKRATPTKKAVSPLRRRNRPDSRQPYGLYRRQRRYLLLLRKKRSMLSRRRRGRKRNAWWSLRLLSNRRNPLQNTRPHPREEAKQVSEPAPEAEEDCENFCPPSRRPAGGAGA